MSLKDTLRSLAKQGKIAGTLAMGTMSADAASNMDVDQIQQAVEAIVKKISEPRVKRTTSEALLEEVLKTPTQPVSATMRVLTDKELWTPDFQEGMDNLVHEFLQASPHQIQNQTQNIQSNDVENDKFPVRDYIGDYARQTELKAGEALTMRHYRNSGIELPLSVLPMLPESVSKIRIGTKHSGTDTHQRSYLDELKDKALGAFLPPNAEFLYDTLNTAQSVMDSEHSSTRLVGGYDFDDGAKLNVALGSVPIMEEFSSRGMVAPVQGHTLRDRFNVDQQVKNAICFDYVTKDGEVHRLGYAENNKRGTIFSYDGKDGEVFYVGSKNALEDKLQFAYGARAATALDGFEGFCSVKYNPTDNAQAMFEVQGIGTNDPRCVASFQQNTPNFVFGALAAASQREQALYGTVEHKESGWYAAAGAECVEKSPGDKQTGFSAMIGKKWTFGGR